MDSIITVMNNVVNADKLLCVQRCSLRESPVHNQTSGIVCAHLCSRALLSLFVLLLLAASGCSKGKYPGTAQQTGTIYLAGCAKRIATGAQNFYLKHDRWPTNLDELAREENIASSDLLYPDTRDLPDRRDILKFQDNLTWIYLPPKDNQSRTPLVLAPLPFDSSMGKRLPKPKRIVVRLDSPPEELDEDSITAIIGSIPTK